MYLFISTKDHRNCMLLLREQTAKDGVTKIRRGNGGWQRRWTWTRITVGLLWSHSFNEVFLLLSSLSPPFSPPPQTECSSLSLTCSSLFHYRCSCFVPHAPTNPHPAGGAEGSVEAEVISLLITAALSPPLSYTCGRNWCDQAPAGDTNGTNAHSHTHC